MAGISAKNIRNIALLGHGGEGKTTLAEAILFNAKAIDRQGRVDDGNTTMDFDPEEIGKKISISLATANATFKGVKLNLIDVPGFFDFEGEFVQAMTVADCALVVTGPGGTLPVGTEKALDYCVAHKVPTMIFINGMDKENANYWDTVNAVSQKYSTKIVPLMIPLMENGKMTGYANVLEGLFYKVGAHGENGQPLPDSLKSKYDELKGVVMEKAAESDEELLMKFFDSGELSAEEMVKGMKQGVKEGAAIGVFGGSALANFGVFNLMNNLISMMPSAAEAKPVVAFDENDKPTELKPDENAPVVIRIFKTIADPFVGRLSLFKVVSGTLKSGLTLKNASKDSEEKNQFDLFLERQKTGDGGRRLRGRHRRFGKAVQCDDGRHFERGQGASSASDRTAQARAFHGGLRRKEGRRGQNFRRTQPPQRRGHFLYRYQKRGNKRNAFERRGRNSA